MSQNTAREREEAPGPAGPQKRRSWGALRKLVLGLIGQLDPVKQRALTALLIRVAGAALAYLMQILLAQWMGLTQYGIFVGVWVWLLVLGGISPLGLNISLIGHLATHHEAGDLARWRGLLMTGIWVTLLSGTLIAVAGLTFVWTLPHLIADAYLMPVWLCLFCVPLFALSEVNEGIARAHGWMNTALLPTYLLRPLFLIVGCFLAIQAGFEPNAVLAMTMAIGAALLTIAIQGLVLVVRLSEAGGSLRGERIATPLVWVGAALPIVVAQTFELLTQNFDLIAVSYFLGAEATGIYFAALKTIALLAFVNFAVGAASANRVASLHAAGHKEEFHAHIQGAVNLAFWPTLIGAIAIVALSPFLLSLFGRDFTAHAYLTGILAFGFVAKGFVGPAELFLNVLGQQRACALVLMSAAALNIALNVVLIPWVGLAGAAIATAMSFVVLALALFVIARRRLGIVLAPTVPWSSLARIWPRLAKTRSA